jgi:hypothetical protein
MPIRELEREIIEDQYGQGSLVLLPAIQNLLLIVLNLLEQ